jgi:hypothetical protein
MADTKEPTDSCSHNNTQHTKNMKHPHHGPPKPLASSSFNFTGECICRTTCDWSQSLQHDNVLSIDNTNFSFIYLTIILCAVVQHAHWLKVSLILLASKCRSKLFKKVNSTTHKQLALNNSKNFSLTIPCIDLAAVIRFKGVLIYQLRLSIDTLFLPIQHAALVLGPSCC